MLKTFLFGNIMSVNRIQAAQATVDDARIEIYGEFQDSALAYRGFRYRIENGSLYVKVYSVVVSPLYKYGAVKIDIEGDFANITNIFLEDNDNIKLIWGRN